MHILPLISGYVPSGKVADTLLMPHICSPEYSNATELEIPTRAVFPPVVSHLFIRSLSFASKNGEYGEYHPSRKAPVTQWPKSTLKIAINSNGEGATRNTNPGTKVSTNNF